MYRFIFFAILVFGDYFSLQSQNLVKNGSFEDLTMCLDQCENDPVITTSIAVGWKTATSQTPDIFSPCNFSEPQEACTNYFSPSNWQGYQFAYDGNNYAGYSAGGILFDSSVSVNSTEYISNSLIQELDKKNYCISYKVAAASNLYFKKMSQQDYYLYAVTNKTGVYFSKNQPFEHTFGIYPHTPQVWLESDSSEYLNDTTNWDIVANFYQANGGEEYITIGNFVPYDEVIYHVETNIPIDEIGLYAGGVSCYQYIDDVQLIEIPELIVSADTAVYPQSSISLSTPTLAEGYEWFEIDTLHSLGVGNAITISPEISTSYFLKATQCKLTTWDTVNVTVIPRPIIPVSISFLNTITSSHFQIQYQGDYKPLLDVEVFNSVGQIIKTLHLSETTFISLDAFTSGVYYCRLSKEGIPIKTSKVVKVD